MDWMTPLGYLVGFSTVLFALARGGSMGLIFNAHALLLVYGGTLGATLLTYPSTVISQAVRGLRIFFLPGDRPKPAPVIALLIQLSEKARRQGLESLAPDIAQIRIPYLARGLQMVLDGIPTEILKNDLLKEARFARDRHTQVSNVFRSMATYSPIFGLLGTLVGVVQVLMTLTDPKTIGTSMAVAMTATFYGIFGANFLFLPIAGKLTVYSHEEVFLQELMIEGILAIQQNEVPALVSRKLQAFAEARQRERLQPRAAAARRAAA